MICLLFSRQNVESYCRLNPSCMHCPIALAIHLTSIPAPSFISGRAANARANATCALAPGRRLVDFWADTVARYPKVCRVWGWVCVCGGGS